MTGTQEPIEDPDQFLDLAPVDRQYIVLGLPPSTPAWRWLLTPTAVWEGFKKLVVAPGAPPVVPIKGRVAQYLDFPQGQPQHGHVYRAHPKSTSEYLTVASFHPAVLRDKFEEALAISIRLGATSVTAHFYNGNRLTFEPTVTLPQAPNMPIEVKAGGGTGHTYQFTASFRSGPPSLPEGTRWLDAEPSWNALVDAALDQRIDHFDLSVEVKTDFGLNTSAQQGLRAGGLKIGGNFQGFRETSYSLAARFS